MSSTDVSTRRRAPDKWLAVSGLGGYAVLALPALRGPGRRERSVFTSVQGVGDSLPLLRVPQQLGTPWLLPLVAVSAFAAGRQHLAAAAALALPLEKGLEVAVKDVVVRDRPAAVAGLDAELHDDAPVEGGSYPSGHAAIAACAATLVAAHVSPWLVPLLVTTVAATTLTRVHQGAHLPLDVVGGVLMGVGLGSGLTWTFGVPAAG